MAKVLKESLHFGPFQLVPISFLPLNCSEAVLAEVTSDLHEMKARSYISEIIIMMKVIPSIYL